MKFTFKLDPHETVEIDGAKYVGGIDTQYQRVEILDLPGLGETIFIDGAPQISAADAFMFNELIVHAPLCLVKNPTVIFLAGVASGGAIAEVLKYSSVSKIYAVDIDRDGMEFLAQRLSFSNASALANPRVQLEYEDARTFLSESIPDGALDVIIVDLPDPVEESPSQKLFNRTFYAMARRKLNKGGVLFTQSGRFRLGAMSYHARVKLACSGVFRQVKTHHFYYPCYYEPWSFLLCADETTRFLGAQEIDQLLKVRNINDLVYYSGATDKSTSQIPPLIGREVKTCEAEILGTGGINGAHD